MAVLWKVSLKPLFPDMETEIHNTVPIKDNVTLLMSCMHLIIQVNQVTCGSLCKIKHFHALYLKDITNQAQSME